MITKYEIGLPCMLGESVGKIVGESEKGSSGILNGERFFSIVHFSTPHGTVIETGIVYLNDITEEGLEKLKQYEEDVKLKHLEPYNGKLK